MGNTRNKKRNRPSVRKKLSKQMNDVKKRRLQENEDDNGDRENIPVNPAKRRALERGEGGNSGESPSEPGVERISDDMALMRERAEEKQVSDESDEELCIQIKEEAAQTIPVEFLASTSELPLQPPQYNIAVAPTSVESNEPAYSISIKEIQDPLSQDTTSTIQDNVNNVPLDNDSFLRPRGFMRVSDNSLQAKQQDNQRERERSKKAATKTSLNYGTKGKKKNKETEGGVSKEMVVKRNPPRQAKSMTYAQELMNKKLSDIMNSQKKILNTLKEMPNVGVDENGAKPGSNEDRFDICGRHIASLLRELPTFDALALEAKLMDIVYKEREKLETFRKSLQGYSASMLPQNK